MYYDYPIAFSSPILVMMTPYFHVPYVPSSASVQVATTAEYS